MSTTALAPEIVETEIVDAEIVTLTKTDAKKLDQRIRRMADATCGNLLKLDELLAEAKAGEIHVALGYKSWTCYVADALGGRPEMTASARKKIVTLLAGEGMSQRGIARATGASKTTVKRDLDNQVVHNGPADAGEPAPTTVTGLDNKQHPKRKPPKPEPEPVATADHTDAEIYVELVLSQLSDLAGMVALLQDDPAFTDEQHRRIIEAVHQLRNLVGC
jgi:hypothetical protein